MTDVLPGDLTRIPDADVLGALSACRSADLEREGIAMYVAVADLRVDRPSPRAIGAVDAAAERLTELFDHYHDALDVAGFPQPDDEPCDAFDVTGGARRLIDVLVVMSDRHLHADVRS